MSGRQLAAMVAAILAIGAVATYVIYGSIFATQIFN